MIITEFNKVQFAADAREAIINKDISKLKVLKEMYGKRQVYLETGAEVELYTAQENDFVTVEPKLLERLEIKYFLMCKADDQPHWPDFLKAPFTPEEIRLFIEDFEANY